MKRRYLFPLAVVMTLSLPLWSQESLTMDERWQKLSTLVNEEMKTIDQVKSKRGPSLEHRYFELMSEKLALIREKETKSYLKASVDDVQKKSKQHYFKESGEYYKKVLEKGLGIIKSYPAFPQRAHILYTMALNSRDFGQDKKTESFLLESLRHAPAGDPIVHMAKTSMAEYYYNEKQYAQAIRYYRDVLQNKKDEWLPKHHYNLSWCLLKEKDFSGALHHLHTAFNLGQVGDKVQVRDQVLEAVPLFHTLGQKIDEGRLFLLKHAQPPVPLLMKLAKQASDKGHFQDSMQVIQSTKTHIQAGLENDINPAMEIILTEMDIFKSFKKEDMFFQAAKNASLLVDAITKVPLKVDMVDEAIEKIRAEVGFKQLLLTQNAKKRVKVESESSLKRVIDFFDIMSRLRPSLKAQNEYFKGETYFSTSRFGNALKSYHAGDVASAAIVDEKERNEWRQKIIKAMLGTLSESDLNKKDTDFFTEYAFVKHLEYWPINDASREIYPRLITLLRQKKDIAGSESYLMLYHKNYPQDLQKQQDLLTHLIDDSIVRKDVAWLNGWINKLNQGTFQFDKMKIEKLTGILGDLLYEKILALETKGQWDKAFSEHEALYEQHQYPAVVRGRSALNAAVLATKKDDRDQAQQWWHRAYELLQDKNFLERSQLHLGIISTYPELGPKYIERFCKSKAPHKEEIANAVVYDLLKQGDRQQTLKHLRRFHECLGTVPKMEQLHNELVSQSRLFNDRAILMELYNKPMDVSDKSKQTVAVYLKEMAGNEFWGTLHHERAVFLSKLQAQYPAGLLNELAQQFKTYVQWENELAQWHKSAVLSAHTPFDPARYNQELNLILQQYQAFIERGKAMVKNSAPEFFVLMNQELEKSWQSLGQQVSGYMPMGIDDQDFIKSFRQQMQQLAKTFYTRAGEHRQITLQSIEKSHALLYSAQQRFPASGHTHFSHHTKLEKTPYGLSFDRQPQHATQKMADHQ